MEYRDAMALAIEKASESGQDVPVGAVLISADGKVVAAAHNQKEQKNDASSHAEIEVIRAAGAHFGDWRLDNCTLVVTLEPCVMCAGAIIAARIPKVVFGAYDQEVGAAGSQYDLLRDARLGEPVEVVGGVMEAECSQLLTEFFRERRKE